MSRRLALASAALLCLAASPALAQDWSGPYFGAAIGYAKQTGNDSETLQFDKNLDGNFGDTVTTAAGANAFSPGFCNGQATGATPASACSEQDDGIDFQLRAGYDWQFGGLVLGGVAEFGVSDVEDTVSAFSTTPASYTFDRDVQSMFAGRVRAGYVVGSYLPYITGGVVRAKIDHGYNTSNGVNTFSRSDDEYADGYQVGLGLEREVVPSVRVGVEYMFTRLEDDSFRVRAMGPAPATNPFILTNANGTDFRRSETDFDIQAVRATVSYAF